MAKKFYRKRYKGKRRAPLSHRQVKAISKIANKQIHKMSEMKVLTGTINGSTVDSVGGTYGPDSISVPYPSAGTGATNRVGEVIYLKSVSLRGVLDAKQLDNNFMRIVVVQDLESNADGVLEYGDIFELTSGDNCLNSFYKNNPERKFKVLSDLTYNWDGNNASAPKPWSVSLGQRDLRIRKPQITATGTTGQLRLFIFGGEGATGPAMTERMKYRIRFYDS